jgi:hypothetical protein
LTVRRLLLGIVVLGLALAPGAGRAGAQEAGDEGGRLVLVDQTTWLAEEQPFELSFRSTDPLPEDGTLELTLYGAVTSRDTLVQAEQDRSVLGDVRDTLSVALVLAPPDADGVRHLVLRTDGSGSALPVGPAGVYPLEIAAHGPDGALGRPMLTYVVRVDEAAGQSPLLTSLVLPLHVPPSYGPDGTPTLSERARRIFRVRSGLLRRFDDVPMSVVPTPESLDALADVDPDLLGRVRSTLNGRHVVAGPYVRLDLAAYAADPNLAGPLVDQFAAGRRTLRRLLRGRIDQGTWAGTSNPTTAALDALYGVGVDRGVFRAESTVGEDVAVTEPVVLTGATGQRFEAVLVDPALRGHVNSTADPVLMAHRALADLALLASPPDEGGVATDSGDAGVVIELPATRPLPVAYLRTLLQGLEARGPLAPVSLATLFDQDPTGQGGPEPGPDVEGIPVAGQDLDAYGRGLALTKAQLTGYASFAGRADPTASDLRRRLLVSGAMDLTEAERSDYLRAATNTIRQQIAKVTVADDVTITLTSREGDIPITIDNATGGPVEVVVAFDSDNRLAFPDGARQLVRLTEGTNRIDVPVVARTSGAFPLRITASSPDGVLTVTRARITVRSTVVSGVGVVLSVGALLVLAVWWISHWRSTRRNRRLVDPEDLPVNTDPDQVLDAGNEDDGAPV